MENTNPDQNLQNKNKLLVQPRITDFLSNKKISLPIIVIGIIIILAMGVGAFSYHLQRHIVPKNLTLPSNNSSSTIAATLTPPTTQAQQISTSTESTNTWKTGSEPIDSIFSIGVCKNTFLPVTSKSGLVQWVEPKYLKNSAIFASGANAGDNGSDSGYFGEDDYLVGHFISGKYKGGDLFLVIQPYPSFAGAENIDHVVSLNGKYYLMAKYSDHGIEPILPWVTASGVILDKNFDLSDLDFSEQISLNNPIATFSHVKSYSFENLEHTRFCGDNLIKSFKDPVAGDIYTESTTTTPKGGFYVKVPDGTQRVYALDMNIVGKNNVPLVTWNDESKNLQEYTYANGGGCVATDFTDTVNVSLIDLVQIGYTMNGDPIYGYKDPQSSGLMEIYKAWLDPTISSSSQDSFETFSTKHPVFFWKNQFGQLVRFINSKYKQFQYCG